MAYCVIVLPLIYQVIQRENIIQRMKGYCAVGFLNGWYSSSILGDVVNSECWVRGEYVHV